MKLNTEKTELRSKTIKAWAENVLPLAGLLFVFIFFLIATKGGLLSPSNIKNISDQVFKTLIVSVGAVFIYAHGGFDMSLGAISGVSQMIMSLIIMKTNSSLPPLVIMLIGVGICVLLCVTNAVLHVGLKVPIFVATMCMNFACTGLLVSVVQSRDVTIPYTTLAAFNTSAVRVATLIAVVVVYWCLFEKTKIGKSLKAIGGSRVVATQSGINVNKMIITAFALAGICVGIVSFLSLSRANKILGSTGGNIQMDAMIAIVLGGMPLAGGASSKLRAAVIGALTITLLTNGMTIMGLDYSYVNVTKGLLFVIIVTLSYRTLPNKFYD